MCCSRGMCHQWCMYMYMYVYVHVHVCIHVHVHTYTLMIWLVTGSHNTQYIRKTHLWLMYLFIVLRALLLQGASWFHFHTCLLGLCRKLRAPLLWASVLLRAPLMVQELSTSFKVGKPSWLCTALAIQTELATVYTYVRTFDCALLHWIELFRGCYVSIICWSSITSLWMPLLAMVWVLLHNVCTYFRHIKCQFVYLNCLSEICYSYHSER